MCGFRRVARAEVSRTNGRTFGDGNRSDKEREPHQTTSEAHLGDTVEEQCGPQGQTERPVAGKGLRPPANGLVAGDQEPTKKREADDTHVEIDLEKTVVCLINVS